MTETATTLSFLNTRWLWCKVLSCKAVGCMCSLNEGQAFICVIWILFPSVLLQLTPLPSCTDVSAGSFWRELFSPSSSRRATLQAAARTTLGTAVNDGSDPQGLHSVSLSLIVFFVGFFSCSATFSGSFPMPWSSSSCWTAARRTLPPLLLPSRLLPVTPPFQVWLILGKKLLVNKKHWSQSMLMWRE